MKRNVAKENIFTKQGMTAIESVEQTNIHDILFYLNIQAIEAKENEQKS